MEWLIEWLFGGNGLFIKILKFYLIVFLGIPAFAGGLALAHFVCKILKKFLGELSHYLKTEKQPIDNMIALSFVILIAVLCLAILQMPKEFRRGVYPEFLQLKIRVSIVESEVNKQLRRIDDFLIRYDKKNNKKWWQVWR